MATVDDLQAQIDTLTLLVQSLTEERNQLVTDLSDCRSKMENVDKLRAAYTEAMSKLAQSQVTISRLNKQVNGTK